MKQSTIDAFISHLERWNTITNIDELDNKWKVCKYWIINNSDNFDERKELDLICQDYYIPNRERLLKNIP